MKGDVKMHDCIEKVREKAGKLFAKNLSDTDTIKNVVMTDTSLIFNEDGTATQETISYVDIEYTHKCKSGRIQNKKKSYAMTHQYCPFCGKKYKKSEG